MPERVSSVFKALHNRDYLLYWIGATVSFVGSHLQGTVQGWYVFKLTGGSFHVGLVGFLGQLPMVLTLLGGVVADRVDKRKLLIITQTCMMGLAFLLGALVQMQLAGVWTIAALAIVGGVAGAFDSPARHSIAIHLVGKEALMNAIGLNSASFNAARIVGPAIAGALLAKIGVAPCFFINGISYIAVIAALIMIKSDTSGSADGESRIWADFRAGLSYTRNNPTVRTLVLMAGIPSLFVLPYQTLMPEFASKVLNVNEGGYGVLMASVGVGALLGALRLANDNRETGRGKTILLTGAVNAGLLLALSVCRTYAFSALILIAMGAMSVTYNATINTLLQTISDHQFRARVVSAYIFIFLGMAPIGSLMAGILAHRFGVTMPLALGGFGVAATILLVAITQPRIRNL